MPIRHSAVLFAVLISAPIVGAQKPKLTLDDFFNSVSFRSLEISPDGNSVVIVTQRADWDQQIFRSDLWLYRDAEAGSLIQLTQSGHDSEPKWSPDGKWIAFVSERKSSSAKSDDADSDSKGEVSQLYLISPHGGEAVQLTQGEENVHAFAWSADSQSIYYATRQPWTKKQKDDYKNEWKDVVEYRTAERGDTIFALDVNAALSRNSAAPATAEKREGVPNETADLTPGARPIGGLSLRVDELVTSPDGKKLAVLSNAINQRQEKYDDVELYLIDLSSIPAPSPERKYASIVPAPRRITHNEAVEFQPRWASDNHHIFFNVEVGDPLGPYRDLQPHLYWVDIDSGKIEQWSKDFAGPVDHFAVVGADVKKYSSNSGRFLACMSCGELNGIA